MAVHLENTDLFRLLTEHSRVHKSGPLDTTELLGVIVRATRTMAHILNRSCRVFEYYTLHDEQHAVRIINIMHLLIGPEIAAQLSPVDIALLILSAYAHDLGMTMEKEERERVTKTEEYKTFLLRHSERQAEAEHARQTGDSGRFASITDQLLQDYVRGKHHILSAEAVRGPLKSIFDVGGLSLAESVADLSQSHGEPISALSRLRHLPFATIYRSDIQFLACLLRLADFLDLDPLRAPSILLDAVKGQSELSWREWGKHRVNFLITPTAIEFSARFSDFYVEKAFRDTLSAVEAERGQCMELLRDRPDAGLQLRLHRPIQSHLESSGYVYEEFQFSLEYEHIMPLLMGTALYKDERAFVRELLQNAIDACRYSMAAAFASGRRELKVEIVATSALVGDGRQVIEVSDTGAGMTRDVIRNYFMRVGRSFYQSFEFQRKQLGVNPIGQFGIGILSCFLNADYIEVETYPDPIAFPDLRGGAKDALRLEIRGPYQFFVVREAERRYPGTSIRVYLNRSLDESLMSVVEHFLLRSPIPVFVDGNQLRTVAFGCEDAKLASAYVSPSDAIQFVPADMRLDGGFGVGVHGMIRFFLLKINGRVCLTGGQAGNYSRCWFNELGEAWADATHITSEMAQALRDSIGQLRAMQPYFQVDCALELAALLRSCEALIEECVAGGGSDGVDVRWQSISAQLGVLRLGVGFRSHPLSVAIERGLRQLLTDVRSRMEGRVRLGAPAGILTQDGIDMTGAIALPQQINLQIGYVYNLDLCGETRFQLNAARDRVVLGDKSRAVIGTLHAQMGTFLGRWFRECGIEDDEVRRFARNASSVFWDSLFGSFHDRSRR